MSMPNVNDLSVCVEGDLNQPSPTHAKVDWSYLPASNPYVIRFKPLSQDGTEQVYDYETVIDEFLSQFDVWAIGEELYPQLHYHMYIETSLLLPEVKKLVQDFIYPYYPVRTRGFGSQSNTQISTSPIDALRYLFKQKGRSDYSGFRKSFIKHCRDTSFIKPDDAFNDQLETLYAEFVKQGSSPYLYASKIAILHSQFDRLVNWSKIQSYVNSKIIKNDPSQSLIQANKNLRF